MLRLLLFKLYLFFNGIKFYKTEAVPKSPEFRSAIFETVGKHKVGFYFYRETYEDLIFCRGKIRRSPLNGYVIQVKFDEGHVGPLYQYNNLKFFFNRKFIPLTDENRICEILLGIYMDFLRSELKE